jgi:hypothetical protein
MSVPDMVKEIIGNGGREGHAAWARTAVVIIAFGVMLWFDPRIAYMQTQIADNATAIKVMDGQGTRHSSQTEIELRGIVLTHASRIQKLEDRYDKIDNTLTALLNRIPERPK